MPIDWAHEVIDQIESHWTHQLRPRLVGLSDAEHRWEPVSRDLASAESVPTIAWRLDHVTVGLAVTNATHFNGPAATFEDFEPAGSADEALHRIDGAFEHWIDGVRMLGEEGLRRPQGPTSPSEFADAPMARLVMYTSVELIHHGAEVCLLRDLFEHREDPDET